MKSASQFIETTNGPLKEKLWINSDYEITVTKNNQYRLWDNKKIKTIAIFETLEEAKRGIE